MAVSILKHCGKYGVEVMKKNILSECSLYILTMKTTSNQRHPLLIPPSFNVHQVMRNYSKHVKHSHAERRYDSDSESDSDLEWIGHRGESDFWRRKIRTFHGIIDLNKDGVISFDDFKLLSDRFINLGHLQSDQVQKFQEVLRSLWEKQFGEISPYNLVSVERYLENMHHVLNDKRLVRKAHSFLPYLFKAVDKDRSGEITVEEFKLFFKVLGLKEHDAVLAFRAIDSNVDGKISHKEFVKHGRDFFLTEDPDRISKYFWGPLVEH
ncbi:sarcoplasmic calcium-binding protein [Diorhabda carinulata]|uniref:sarcoplasmic calcium-binding protein n=1 Tax=Diorhabda sublineata TaxID=1163346 RepID=UPI0024E1144D|nr:sarcoplasmic calcium-binding protein [Diorhabda sublineata]XP_057672661.1 sarcoplasmic calcium-binding protein [Diorhabda carinulata]